MSRFFSTKYSELKPYVPGEQPIDRRYIKLNTNESPYPPSQSVIDAVKKEAGKLQLYSDPECNLLVKKCSEIYGVEKNQVIMSNGSDEILNFAFMAFCDSDNGIVFPEITYGFYSVFSALNNIPYTKIPLTDNFSINYLDYVGINKNIVIANPNAPTGIALSPREIEEIVKSNPNNVVIIDEAYVDFGAKSAVKLVNNYDNLIVVQTFSKSRSLAGARLGFAIANKDLISDLNTIRFSTNPYNVNRMTMVAGYHALEDNAYYMENCKKIIETREYTKKALEDMNFQVLPSCTNFLFARSSKIGGETLYLKLKENGILVRHFSDERIKDFNRITIGTFEEMQQLLNSIEKILKEIE